MVGGWNGIEMYRMKGDGSENALVTGLFTEFRCLLHVEGGWLPVPITCEIYL